MRLTQYKKEITPQLLSLPTILAGVRGEIGNPPFDVSGVAYLLYGMDSTTTDISSNQQGAHLKRWSRDGLLERVLTCMSGVREQVMVFVEGARYGLPGHSCCGA